MLIKIQKILCRLGIFHNYHWKREVITLIMRDNFLDKYTEKRVYKNVGTCSCCGYTKISNFN